MIESQVVPLLQRSLDGELMILRGIPTRKCRSIGPWCFFDKLEVSNIGADNGLAVASHPHIGLQILSWLLKGKVQHQDSLGNKTVVDESSFNFMTAGRGIVHTEDSIVSTNSPLEQNNDLHLLQLWLALPKQFEEISPDFMTIKKSDLPSITLQNGYGRLIAGNYPANDLNKYTSIEAVETTVHSPLHTYSPLIAMEVILEEGESWLLLDENYEYGISLIEGNASFQGRTHIYREYWESSGVNSSHINLNTNIEIDNELIAADIDEYLEPLHKNLLTPEVLLQFSGVKQLSVKVTSRCRFLIFGGEPLQDEHHIWWNYVSSDSENIREKHMAWQNRDEAIFPYIEDEERADLQAPEIPNQFLSL